MRDRIMGIIEGAVNILKANDLGGYTIPTSKLYPYQWNWDSAFTALGWAEYDLDRAWQELETLVEGQWDNGMIPHILFRKNDPNYFPGPEIWDSPHPLPTSCYSQPPVFASTIYRLLQKRSDTRGLALYRSAFKWHRWWMENRLDPDFNLLFIAHPWESGRDNAACWDEAMRGVEVDVESTNYVRRDTEVIDSEQRPKRSDYDRYMTLVKFGKDHRWDPQVILRSNPFRVIDEGINFIFYKANHDLLRLAEYWGQSEDLDEIQGWQNTIGGNLDKLWNEEINAFAAINPMTGVRFDGISNASFLVFYSGWDGGKFLDVMIENYKKIVLAVEFGIPSLNPDHPSFEPMRYWRGPVWLVMNYMVGQGLLASGNPDWVDLGERLKKSSAQLIHRSGFYEYFNPLDGKGLGGDNFSWTSAIGLAWGLL